MARGPARHRHLFLSPVASDSGLGVGLYQAARQAARVGYRLELPGNQVGQVTFRLQATEEGGMFQCTQPSRTRD